jgi:hypothetical protein
VLGVAEVVDVGVGVGIEVGMVVEVSVEVGEMVEVNESGGEGVGVGETEIVLCCGCAKEVEAPTGAGRSAADAR